jgi:trimeric autotransporter adhesin
MSSMIVRKSGFIVLSMLFAAAAIPVAASTINVIVNGQNVTFDQPPVERAGRVFVPLRGIFERLGASVVYQHGVINATSGNRTITLHIGSTQATVNGQSQYLDSPPFVIGSRTLVPLRFVAQALGASVEWQQANNTVAITGTGGPQSGPSNASFNLTNKRPATNANTLSPAIHAEFSEPIQRDSLRVDIDGQDVTNNVYVNANGFDVTPSSPLSSGSHRVRVRGTTQAGASFSTGWTFTTGGAASSGENYIRNVQPAQNTNVGSNFTFSGRTLPNARVHIVASGQANVGGLFQVGTGTFQTDVTADSSGNFNANISVNAVRGSQVRVLVQSTAPGGSSVERTYTYNV